MKINRFLPFWAIILMASMILYMPFLDANLGTFKQNTCVEIRTILNSTSAYLVNLDYPNSTSIVQNKQMTKNGQNFNYTICNNSALGTYIYSYNDSVGNVYVNSYLITPSGESGTAKIAEYLFIALMLYAISFLGFFLKNEWVAVLGGMAMIAFGIYTINNGMIIFQDWFTNYFSYVTIGLGAIFALVAIIETIEENL